MSKHSFSRDYPPNERATDPGQTWINRLLKKVYVAVGFEVDDWVLVGGAGNYASSALVLEYGHRTYFTPYAENILKVFDYQDGYRTFGGGFRIFSFNTDITTVTVQVTEDGGANWVEAGSFDVSDQTVRENHLFNFTSGDHLLVLGQGFNHVESQWQAVVMASGPDLLDVISVETKESDIYYLTATGLFRSTDSGVNFNSISTSTNSFIASVGGDNGLLYFADDNRVLEIDNGVITEHSFSEGGIRSLCDSPLGIIVAVRRNTSDIHFYKLESGTFTNLGFAVLGEGDDLSFVYDGNEFFLFANKTDRPILSSPDCIMWRPRSFNPFVQRASTMKANSIW